MAKQKKTTTRRPTVVNEAAKYRRQSDLRTLQDADAIRSDPSRLRGAKREAISQRRALDRVAKK